MCESVLNGEEAVFLKLVFVVADGRRNDVSTSRAEYFDLGVYVLFHGDPPIILLKLQTHPVGMLVTDILTLN